MAQAVASWARRNPSGCIQLAPGRVGPDGLREALCLRSDPVAGTSGRLTADAELPILAAAPEHVLDVEPLMARVGQDVPRMFAEI